MLIWVNSHGSFPIGFALLGIWWLEDALTALRSLGDLGARPFGVLAPETWKACIEAASWLSTACLTVAMASVGLGTSFARLRSLGLRPLAGGLATALLVGGVSYALIRWIAPVATRLIG